MDKQKNIRPSSQKKVSEPKVLLSAIESVAISAKNSQLCDQFFIDREVELKYLADSYDADGICQEDDLAFSEWTPLLQAVQCPVRGLWHVYMTF